MKKTIISRDSILWHDGMMLAAKHFQQMTDRLEEMIVYQSSLSSPFNWGIKALKIDKDLLAHGKLVVEQIEAILPDGLIIHDSKTNKNNLELNLLTNIEAEKITKEKLVKIFLFVPPKGKGELSDSSQNARYKPINPVIIEEENSRFQDVAVPYQIPNASLVIANDLPDELSSIPLVQIKYSNGQFQLTDFIPPMLYVEQFSELGKIVSELVQIVRMKALFISKQISPTSIQYEPAILDKRLLLQNLLAGLPPIEAYLQAGVGHPFNIYLLLCSLLGNISPLGYDILSTELIPYDHNNLQLTYSKIKKTVAQILDESIGDNYHAIPFECEGDVFKLIMNKYWLAQKLVLGVQSKEGKTEKDVLMWMMGCLIGNADDIKKMRKERTLGAQRYKVEQDPNFPPAINTIFFKIEQESIRPDMELYIFNPSDKPGQTVAEKINLYIKKRTEI
jgi:type VI secretion system protein ImpJ